VTGKEKQRLGDAGPAGKKARLWSSAEGRKAGGSSREAEDKLCPQC